MDTLKKESVVRGLKLLDIGYLSLIYFTIAFGLTIVISNYVLGEFDPKEQEHKSSLQLFLECFFHFWMLLVIIYFVRNMMEFIPFPFDGYMGFEHMRVEPAKKDVAFTFLIMWFPPYLRDKIQYLYKRFTKVRSVQL